MHGIHILIPTNTPTITPSLDDIADQQFRTLKDGKFVFNPPKEMMLGDIATVRLRITKTGSVSAAFQTGMERGRRTMQFSEKVGTVMSAKLTGDKFTITPLTDEIQFMVSDRYNEWA